MRPTESVSFKCHLSPRITSAVLFDSRSETLAKRIRELRKPGRYYAGSTIFRSGDAPEFAYILVNGFATVTFRPPGFSKHLVRRLHRDEVVGLTEIISGLPYETDLKTLTFCALDLISRDDLLTLLADEPDLSFHIAEILSFELQNLSSIFQA